MRARQRTDALWVVDGQQRITSLFGSLSPGNAGIDDRFEVYFDLTTTKFINPRRGVVPPRAIPVREALETRSLLTWLRRHDSDLEISDYDLADRLGGALRDYAIPAYVVTGNDQNLLREVFDRVNSAGRPISRAQVFHALFASDSQPGSPATVVQELRGLRFGALDENRIVQSLLAIRGGNVQRDIHEEFSADEDPADWYDLAEQALARVIEFLRTQGVVHVQLAPNTLPIPVLASFFHLHPDPEPWILRLLARWLWRGWVHGFGHEGGQTPILRRAIRSVHPRKSEPEEAPSAYEAVTALLSTVPDQNPDPMPLEGFRTDKASSRLILLALAALGPVDQHGAPIDLADEFEKYGADAVTELVPQRRSNAAARGFWPTATRPTGFEDPAVLATHAIPPEAARALRSDDIQGFLRIRGSHLSEVTEAFLENRVERRAIVRPPLGDLIVADEDDGGGR